MEVPPKGSLAPNMASWIREYTPGPFSEDDLKQLYIQGFVVKRNLLKETDYDPAIAAVKDLVDEISHDLQKGGKISNLCESEPFETRLIEIEKQFPNASVLLHKKGVLPKGIQNLWACETLMACAKQVLGPDLSGHAVWNLRTKTPQNEQTVVPWHQDTAYLEGACVDTMHLTAWVPLVDATRENGCMEVVRYGHRAGKEVKHECCTGDSWYVRIVDGQLETIGAADPDDVILCDVKKGDVLFLNNVVPHRSLSNVSKGIRWSLDLRWMKTGGIDGFYNLKEPIVMAKGDDPSFKPDWDSWAGVERHEIQLKKALEISGVEEAIKTALTDGVPEEKQAEITNDSNAFDTVIAGPWMGRWEIVHHNKHTTRFKENQAKGTGSDWHSHDKGLKGGAFG